MKKKENSKSKISPTVEVIEDPAEISSVGELRAFLTMVHEKMKNESSAPVYSLAAMNHVLSLPKIYEFLDEENKDLAKAIWMRMKQAGLQLRNPPILFPVDNN